MPTMTEHLSGPIPGFSFSNFLVIPTGQTTPQYIGPHAHQISAGTPNNPSSTPRFVPIRLSRRFRVQAMAIEITAAGSLSSEVTRLGIYAHSMDFGYPVALIQDFGTINTGPGVPITPNFAETASGFGLDLNPGTYWLCEVTTTTGTLCSRRNYASSSAWEWSRTTPLSFAVIVGFVGPNGSADANLPLPNPAVLGGTTGGGGRILLKGIGL